MVINFDQNKRNKTLKERGLDFNDALFVFTMNLRIFVKIMESNE